MTINICMCGTQAGYTHEKDCPFPYFGNDERMVQRWQDTQENNIERRRWYNELLEQEKEHPLPNFEPCGHGVN